MVIGGDILCRKSRCVEVGPPMSLRLAGSGHSRHSAQPEKQRPPDLEILRPFVKVTLSHCVDIRSGPQRMVEPWPKSIRYRKSCCRYFTLGGNDLNAGFSLSYGHRSPGIEVCYCTLHSCQPFGLV